jgi:hypothetical protein
LGLGSSGGDEIRVTNGDKERGQHMMARDEGGAVWFTDYSGHHPEQSICHLCVNEKLGV